jgi:rod shape-determining protein MreB
MVIFVERGDGMITKIGLDLGYANITISNISGDVYRENAVALVDKNSRKTLYIGNDTSKAAPSDSLMLVRPFKNGLLYSSGLTKDVIKKEIKSLNTKDDIRCVVALPSDLVPKQELEIFSMLKEAGVRECYSVNPALSALIGAGYSPTVSAVSVNFGASNTEIAVVHKGEIVISHREKIGGEDFDRAVKDYINDHGGMTVSLLIARTIKEKLGAVWQGKESQSIEIEGIIALTGHKVKMSVSDEDIVGVFEAPLQKFLSAVATTVAKIPGEIAGEILKTGIVLTGGAADIYGLDMMMERVFDIPVFRPVSPIDSVSKGLSRINTFIPVRYKDERNISGQIAKLYESKNSK